MRDGPAAAQHPERLGVAPQAMMVGCGVMGEPYLRSAEALGLRVGIVEQPHRAEDLRARFACVADTEPVDPATAVLEEAWVSPARTLADRVRPRAVIAFSEPHVLAASLVQHERDLPGPGLDAAVASRNKALQRAEFARAGLAQPEARLTPTLADAAPWATQRLPVVVKPLSSTGSAGVELVADPAAWASISRRRAAERPMLVERYVSAQEYSWDALVADGEVVFSSITRKETTGPPAFVETLHEAAFGSSVPVLARAAEQMGRGVVDALRVRSSMVAVEFRGTATGDLAIMEAMVRMPGDHIMEVISRAHDVDLYAAHWQAALGDSAQRLRASHPAMRDGARSAARAAASVFFVADRDGTLADIDFSALDACGGVVRHGIRVRSGTRVRPAESSADRLGFAIVECADRASLLRELDRVRAAPYVRIDEDSQ